MLERQALFFTIEDPISISTLFHLRMHINRSCGREYEGVYESESIIRPQPFLWL
jgi:hypothetical protein